jgi:hypothetical protein
LEKIITNAFVGFRKPGVGAAPTKSDIIKGDRHIRDMIAYSLRARALAFAIFLYFFIQNGTLGLVPERWYIVYRSLRISDFIMFGLIAYSLMCAREYRDLFKSKSFIITKIFLGYLLFEFFVSAIQYRFNVIEYFFRLKGTWASFLVFPYLLLFKRNGWGFLLRLIFPVAIISNILYILSALTGIAFIPDVSIVTQSLPGGISVFRVYGGTFYGEFFMLGIIYLWITKKFKFWQIFVVMLFAAPQVLAFGRNAWIFYVFVILVFVIINALKKNKFRLLARQAVLLGLILLAFIICFIEFIPDSDYYIDALGARIFQGKEDVQYNEGTYGTRVIFQNNSLVKLWSNNNVLIGIGMHPMWVVQPESFEEQVYYNAFCDVGWPGVLAAYGLIGFGLAIYFQIYYIIVSWKTLKKMRKSNVQAFFVAFAFANMIFATFINYSVSFISIGLWGLGYIMSFLIAVLVFYYEEQKKLDRLEQEETPLLEDGKQTLG